MTKEEFIEKAKAVHGDKYDYSKVDYKNAHTKICIICPEHGEFWQLPMSHINKKNGCPMCSGNAKLTTETFIEKAKSIHGDEYDYSKVNYINNRTKVCVICPKHGEFWVRPGKHLQGQKCPLCAHQSFSYTTKSFIDKAKEIHGNKYDYSKVTYKDSHTKICIICPNHGEFWQTPTNHLRGRGCPKCKADNQSINNRMTTEDFIKRAKEIHGDKYNYSKVVYGANIRDKVCIICPDHGEFWQRPKYHLRGNGCPKCKESHLETEIRVLLEKNNIKYEQGAHFKWLGRQHLDFYLPDYNIAIECQGEQHFIKPSATSVRKKPLERIIEQDVNKYNLCQKNNVKLLYYTSKRIDNLAKTKPNIYDDNLYLNTEDIGKKIRCTD